MTQPSHNGSYTGSCLCGTIQYEVSQFEPALAHCHCTMCRKFHGAAFSTFGEAKAEHFRWLKGEDALVSYRASNDTVRKFCGQCGSSLTFESEATRQNQLVEVSLASLDSEVDLHPNAHIFTEHQVKWLSVNDGLPRYQQHRGSKREEEE